MSYTILIVDDNGVIRHMIRSFLEQQGGWLVCGEAENGEEAVSKFQELRTDVVLLDFQMPGLNGLEVARRIKTIAPDTAIVMLTMHYSKELIREAKLAGARQVLSKSDAIRERLLVSLKQAATARTKSEPEVVKT